MNKCVLLCLFALLACGDSSTEPSKFDPNDFVGRWTLSIQAQEGCWPVGTLWFEIDQDDADRAHIEFMNIVSDWQFGNVSGNINFLRESFEINLWKTFPAGGVFFGDGVSTDRLTGTFADKNGGFNPGCSSLATASK